MLLTAQTTYFLLLTHIHFTWQVDALLEQTATQVADSPAVRAEANGQALSARPENLVPPTIEPSVPPAANMLEAARQVVALLGGADAWWEARVRERAELGEAWHMLRSGAEDAAAELMDPSAPTACCDTATAQYEAVRAQSARLNASLEAGAAICHASLLHAALGVIHHLLTREYEEALARASYNIALVRSKLEEAHTFAAYPEAIERAAVLETSLANARQRYSAALRHVETAKLEQRHTQEAHAEGTSTQDDVREAKVKVTGSLNALREQRAAVGDLSEQLRQLLSPYPEQRERLAALVEGKMMEGLPFRSEHDYVELREVRVPGRHGVAKRATHDGVDCFLKRFDEGDEGLRRELRALRRLPAHPAILHPTGYVVSDGARYLEFRYCKHGNLLDHVASLRARLDPPEVHDSVRLLVQQALLGLAHLHQHCCVHKDVKPQNLLLDKEGRVLLTDFELSQTERRSGVTVVTTTLGRGSFTPGYAAPEVERGEPATAASDIFSLGVTLYQLRHNCMPQQHAGQAWDGQPANHVPASGGPLDDLLRSTLKPAADGRLSAHECLLHRFFCESEAVRAREAGELQRSANRLRVARDRLRAAREAGHQRTVPVRVSRSSLLRDGLRLISSWLRRPQQGTLRNALRVHFEGEQGVDVGGLTSEFFTQLWERVVGEPTLFEHGGTHQSYLPHADAQPEQLVAVGALLAKSLFEGRAADFRLAGCIFKFLRGVAPTLHDLEAYDSQRVRGAGGVNALLAMSVAEYSATFGLELDFEDVSGGQDTRAVTDRNKAEYVDALVAHTLVTSRLGALTKLTEGYETALSALAVELPDTLGGLAPRELQILLCGELRLLPAQVPAQTLGKRWRGGLDGARDA